ncbi:MAG: quinone oxidoreductase [Rhodobiaceae bacterium]|nr:quinone oxidoreductase [Rhodobiaceae bacterium]
MMKAVQVHKTGGPEVLALENVAIPEPGAGEIRIRHTAIGLNFIDVYFRSGLYPAPQLPFTPGNEGAGVISAIGSNVDGLKIGDRVAYAATIGSYAQERIIAADRVVRIPEGISDTVAASVMLKGMTAQFLLRRTYKVQPGQTILFHAAAGGVGQIAVKWAKHLGASVIGTAGGPEKCALAKSLGCDHVIDYRTENFVERVKEVTGGKGVSVVYDSVGKDTFPGSLDCLETFGTWVSFGNSSGPVDSFSIGILSQKGCLYATRPTLFTYIARRADLEASAADLFGVLRDGHVVVPEPRTYRLADVAQAHRDLEGRKTTGSSVLIP